MKSIYMTGSSGTGKTTMALLMSDVLRMPIVDGISRSSPFLMGTDDHQQYVSRRVFKKCMTQTAIHCRTPLDVNAHTQVNSSNSPMDKQHIQLFAATKPLVIYFPMLEEIEDDGFRPTDWGFNEKVDTCIKQTLSEYNISYLELSLGSTRERASEIITYLEEHHHGCAKTLLEHRKRLSYLRA